MWILLMQLLIIDSLKTQDDGSIIIKQVLIHRLRNQEPTGANPLADLSQFKVTHASKDFNNEEILNMSSPQTSQPPARKSRVSVIFV